MHTPSCSLAAALTLGLALTICLTGAVGAEPGTLGFREGSGGEYIFDTGQLRGKLRTGGKSLGLSSVVHVPTGTPLDRSNGLFSHYRVFTKGVRYGGGAWDWPSEARLRPDGGVEVRWPAAPGRPFALEAVYRWSAPDTLDLATSVQAEGDLTGFETFLASYFSEGFTNSLARVKGSAGTPATFAAAERTEGDWQVFPVGPQAAAYYGDGRWKLLPNPVDWRLRPLLADPVGMRRAPGPSLTALLMGKPGACFALATPHQAEGHYSFYLSLFGQDLKAGCRATAQTRLVILQDASPETIESRCRDYLR